MINILNFSHFTALASIHVIPFACAFIVGMITGYGFKDKHYAPKNLNNLNVSNQFNPSRTGFDMLSNMIGGVAIMAYISKLIINNDIMPFSIFAISSAIEYKYPVIECIMGKFTHSRNKQFPGNGYTLGSP